MALPLIAFAALAAFFWGIYGVPETFIVGRDDTIVYKMIGPVTADNIDRALRVEIDKALTKPE